MKTITLLLFAGWVWSAQAQTSVHESIPVQSGQQIRLRFDFPQLIKITTWAKNEILITGTVNINGGENDDRFILKSQVTSGVIDIDGHIRDIKSIPHRITVENDGQKMIFKSKEEYRTYTRTHGRTFNRMNNGPDIDITLEIQVPENLVTSILSTYGVIEVSRFAGPLTAESTYGGVDVAVTEQQIGSIEATTDFGEIYTNLNARFEGKVEQDFHTVVSVAPGKGPAYHLESKYGNVYVRKNQ